MTNFEKDWKSVDTSEPMNKYEMFAHGAAFVIVLVALIAAILI
jgi:hypothetical protein